MDNKIRIGTRGSKLALWQANFAKSVLEKENVKAEIIIIKSSGDLNQSIPLYEFGVTGIFTKSLDQALLNNKIDIAVHSLKDVPIEPAKGLKINCVFKRADPMDVLVLKNDTINFEKKLTIATSSIRRKCQWLNKYPHHEIAVLRGNIDSRLEKINKNDWDGAIFAKAGLDRLSINSNKMIVLDWMIPSAAQGTIGIASREEDLELNDLLDKINCKETMHCVNQEREFLQLMGGGCTMPISSYARINDNKLIFISNLCSIDGKDSISQTDIYNKTDLKAGKKSCEKILSSGGVKIFENLKNLK
jgi:hydroxymethylbilane synthase